MLSLLGPPADIDLASSIRMILVISWWLLPLAFALCAWLLHRQRDRQGVKAIAWFAVVVVAGFGIVAASFLLGATYAPHGNASLTVALTSTLGCVFAPTSTNLRYYCTWPSAQFVLLPAIYLVLVSTVVRRLWRRRDPANGSTPTLVQLFSRSSLSFVVRRFLWPAIPIAFIWFLLRNAPDLDPIKLLLVFHGAVFLLVAGMSLFALIARRFRLLPGLIGALLLQLLSIYFPMALLLAGFAPHGPESSVSTVMKIQTMSLALAYGALVLLGFTTSAIFKIRNAVVLKHEKGSSLVREHATSPTMIQDANPIEAVKAPEAGTVAKRKQPTRWLLVARIVAGMILPFTLPTAFFAMLLAGMGAHGPGPGSAMVLVAAAIVLLPLTLFAPIRWTSRKYWHLTGAFALAVNVIVVLPTGYDLYRQLSHAAPERK